MLSFPSLGLKTGPDNSKESKKLKGEVKITNLEAIQVRIEMRGLQGGNISQVGKVNYMSWDFGDKMLRMWTQFIVNLLIHFKKLPHKGLYFHMTIVSRVKKQEVLQLSVLPFLAAGHEGWYIRPKMACPLSNCKHICFYICKFGYFTALKICY